MPSPRHGPGPVACWLRPSNSCHRCPALCCIQAAGHEMLMRGASNVVANTSLATHLQVQGHLNPHLDAIKEFDCHLNVQAGWDDAAESLHNFSKGSSPRPDFPTPSSCMSWTSQAHRQLSEPAGEGEQDPDPGTGGRALMLVVATEPGHQLGGRIGNFSPF